MGNTSFTFRTRVAELSEKVLALELRCTEVLRRADEALHRSQMALEHSRRTLAKAAAIRVGWKAVTPLYRPPGGE